MNVTMLDLHNRDPSSSRHRTKTRIDVSANDNQIKELSNPRRGTISNLSGGDERKQVENKSEIFHSLSLVSGFATDIKLPQRMSGCWLLFAVKRDFLPF